MHDVVIVGAGPVGLFLACELGLAGCSVVVLEREAAPGSPWRAEPLGVRGLFAASLQAFHRRGLLPPLLAASGVHDAPGPDLDADGPPPIRGGVGHFAGIVLDPTKVDLAALPFRLPSLAPDFTMTSLAAVETVLSERAAKLGVEIKRGVTVSGVAQDDEGVVVRAGDDAYAARWAVGCDGGRSTVRRLAGFAFVGTEPRFTGYTVVATLANPEVLRPGINLTPTGMYLRLRAEGHIGAMDFDGGAFDRSQPPTLDHLQTVLRRVSGTEVTLREVHRASTFTDRAMQTTTYRQGRVLLAGDAAHIHSPLGGQGLNTGLGDALNLGWKLAATVHGHAPDGLLDTYTRERHLVGAQVLDWSRAQVAAMAPDRHGQAVQGVLRDLLGTQDGTTYAFGKLSGSSVRHDLGSEHPLVGRNAPDFRLGDGTYLADLMHDGRGVVLDFGAGRRLRDAAADRPSLLRYAAGTAKDDLGLGAVLVRPDGVVAWVGARGFDHKAFEQAADRWFGNAGT
ncbi:FAD-dependent oxidoreductase [Streptomyces noursei ZPM]|uniref:FAD-dependent oxidoreductase n=1 Tax=Streptomyces noursei TaxID=1971 RepID=A0A401QPW9_STRNR|nr:FAD-dependent monooxygenase [Streptomyces noursei]AKA08139.1 FAD-dependent oxidoreductase [Streptomyces noursei ZPM]EOS99622.1 FAD-dependent oxidoreductase [Streptomyces noursei CCRC 11814]EXU91224.1 FAD-dependent oxidoreductase [Streptomyces noursei PD-1]UWS76773.1 FAD-dependent monooxygenase [Streptomyces noursei]GCB87469.1 FAD-dependent oxidoreductase [Streptomyces noursei]